MRQPVHRWVEDEAFDVDYHVRHSALPAPGGERELGILVSRLHSNQLDFSRPPWELHVIEGLDARRFAVYVKIHHSLVDGFTGHAHPPARAVHGPRRPRAPVLLQHPQAAAPGRDPARGRPGRRRRVDPAQPGVVGRGLALGAQGPRRDPAAARAHPHQGGHELPGPRLDPQPAHGRSRRFATQEYRLRRLRAIANARNATLNDVLMAICAGGLRRWLTDLDALPDRPLIAFIPVNVRPTESEGGGNAVGATLVSLATDVEDPLARLTAITASSRAAKARMRGMSADAVIAYSALLLAPAGLQVARAMTGLPAPVPLTLNVCISNVPGPSEHLHLRGARLEATYPVSIPGHSMALNITAHSYAGMLDVGFIGDREALPHLQRLAVQTGEALDELEAAVSALG